MRSGNWWGNDTIWRTCLDLNKIVAYGQSDGSLRTGHPEHRRRHLVLVDGIVAGQGNGPMNPDPLPAGVILLGKIEIAPDSFPATNFMETGTSPFFPHCGHTTWIFFSAGIGITNCLFYSNYIPTCAFLRLSAIIFSIDLKGAKSPINGWFITSPN